MDLSKINQLPRATSVDPEAIVRPASASQARPPEPITADPEQVSAEEDARERALLLLRERPFPQITLAQAGQLAGDHFSFYGRGRWTRLLIDEARGGRLQLTSKLGWGMAGADRVKQRLHTATVEKSAARAWLADHAPAELHESALATWAEFP